MKTTIEKIHCTAVEILENIGIKILDDLIVRLLRRQGIRVENRIAFFTERQVMDRVALTPDQFTLYARNPKYNVTIGNGSPVFIPGYGCSLIIDPAGYRRPATLDDYLRFVKLIHFHGLFKINGGIPAQPNELPVEQNHALMAYGALLFSDKCLIGQPGSEAQVEQILMLAALAFGDQDRLQEKPRVITMVNSHSPLQFDPVALDTIRVHARYRQPVSITAGIIGGTNGPITPAGALALGIAEVLAGITITQILSPRTPVVMGFVIGPGNMQTAGFNLGDPACSATIPILKALSRKYRIPCRACGAGSSANGLTTQAGYEAMMSLMIVMEQNIDVVVHCAGILDDFAGISFEKFITDLEAIRAVKRMQDGIQIDDDSLAVDVIAKSRHGGEYLTRTHTLAHCRDTPWISTIAQTGQLKSHTDAQAAYSAKIEAELDRMLSQYRQPAIDADQHKALERYLIDSGISRQWIKRIQET